MSEREVVIGSSQLAAEQMSGAVSFAGEMAHPRGPVLFKDLLHGLRREANLSQAELSKRVFGNEKGADPFRQRISRMEQGKLKPSSLRKNDITAIALVLAGELNQSVEEVITRLGLGSDVTYHIMERRIQSQADINIMRRIVDLSRERWMEAFELQNRDPHPLTESDLAQFPTVEGDKGGEEITRNLLVSIIHAAIDRTPREEQVITEQRRQLVKEFPSLVHANDDELNRLAARMVQLSPSTAQFRYFALRGIRERLWWLKTPGFPDTAPGNNQDIMNNLSWSFRQRMEAEIADLDADITVADKIARLLDDKDFSALYPGWLNHLMLGTRLEEMYAQVQLGYDTKLYEQISQTIYNLREQGSGSVNLNSLFTTHSYNIAETLGVLQKLLERGDRVITTHHYAQGFSGSWRDYMDAAGRFTRGGSTLTRIFIVPPTFEEDLTNHSKEDRHALLTACMDRQQATGVNVYYLPESNLPGGKWLQDFFLFNDRYVLKYPVPQDGEKYNSRLTLCAVSQFDAYWPFFIYTLQELGEKAKSWRQVGNEGKI